MYNLLIRISKIKTIFHLAIKVIFINHKSNDVTFLTPNCLQNKDQISQHPFKTFSRESLT